MCFCARISDDMGGYDQVGRALRKLIRKGRLLKARLRYLYPRAAIIARRTADADQGAARAGNRGSWPARGRDRADTHGAGLQRRKNNPGADGPRDRRPRACPPHDHVTTVSL